MNNYVKFLCCKLPITVGEAEEACRAGEKIGRELKCLPSCCVKNDNRLQRLNSLKKELVEQLDSIDKKIEVELKVIPKRKGS